MTAFIDKGIEVSKAQRDVIEKYGLSVTREDTDFIVVDLLVSKVFGKASGRLHSDNLEKLLAEIANTHELAVKHGLPTDIPKRKPGAAAPVAKATNDKTPARVLAAKAPAPLSLDPALEGATEAQLDAIKKYSFEVTTVKGGVQVTDPVVAKYYAFKDASKKGKYVGATLAAALKDAVAVRKEHEDNLSSPAKTGKTVTPKATATAKGGKSNAAPKGDGGWAKYDDNAKITILAKENPRKAGTKSAEHWEIYKNGMTVAEFRKAGGIRSKLDTDLAKKRLALK